jgi:hypothetical protein
MTSEEEYRYKFDVSYREKLPDITPSDILDECSNVFEVSQAFPEFEPGTMYVLYDWSEDEIEELEDIVNSTVAKVFYEEDSEGTNCVKICFNNLDESLVKKAEDTLRDFVSKNNQCPDNAAIRRSARFFVTQCMYF